MSHSPGTFAYIGTKSCGHVVAAFVDKPEYAKDIAKEIAKWVRAGMAVDRIPVEDARVKLMPCDCKKRKRKAAQLELPAAPEAQ